MSIRLRLTLLYSAILALTLLAFSTALYAAQARLTYDSIKSNLARQGDAFANPPQRFPRPPEPSTGEGAPPPRPESFNPTGMPGGTLPGRWSQTRSLDGDRPGAHRRSRRRDPAAEPRRADCHRRSERIGLVRNRDG